MTISQKNSAHKAVRVQSTLRLLLRKEIPLKSKLKLKGVTELEQEQMLKIAIKLLELSLTITIHEYNIDFIYELRNKNIINQALIIVSGIAN